jgi:hypothetical protein
MTTGLAVEESLVQVFGFWFCWYTIRRHFQPGVLCPPQTTPSQSIHTFVAHRTHYRVFHL